MLPRWLGGRPRVVRRQDRPHTIRNGLTLLLVLSLLLYAGYTRDIPLVGGGGEEIVADFEAAPNVRAGHEVRVAGVTVGEVTEVARTPDGRGARLRMRLDRGEDVTVHRDAAAHVYWRTMLGRNMYVALEPGSADVPELGDAVISRARTTSQVEFDQLLGSLTEPSREGVQRMLEAFDEGFAGTAPGETIDVLEGAMRPTGIGMDALRGRQAGDLRALVDGTSRTLGALAKEEHALAGVVDEGAIALGVTAARSAELGDFVRSAPGALAELRATSSVLHGTLARLDRAAQALRPGARELDPAARRATVALRELDGMLAAARPTVAALPATARGLGRAGRAGVPMLEAFDPVLDRARDSLLPWLDERDPDTRLRNVEAIGPAFAVGASGAGQYDANGHVQRFQPGGGEHLLGMLPCETYLTDPTRREKIVCRSLRSGLTGLMRQLGGSGQRAKGGR